VTKPDHRARPRRRVVAIAWQIAPHDFAALVGEFAGKGPVEPDKSFLDKLPYLRVAECARLFVLMGRHQTVLISFASNHRLLRGRIGWACSVQWNASGEMAVGTFVFQPPGGGAVSGSGRRPKRYGRCGSS
jgi:hypothetical protein